MRREDRRLSIETKDRPVDVWLFREHANIVRKIARWKIVRPVDDDVVGADNFTRVLAREPRLMQLQLDVRIHVAQAIARRFPFFPADVLRSTQDLAPEI